MTTTSAPARWAGSGATPEALHWGRSTGASGTTLSTPAESRTTQEFARVADEIGQQLREAGFPETAVDAWWKLLVDPNVGKTPLRVWESGDFDLLRALADKALRNRDQYRSALEQLISDHYAERLAQSSDVRRRVLGTQQ